MKKVFIVLVLTVISFFSVINTKAYGFGFRKNNTNDQPDIGKYLDEIAGTDSYYVGDKNEKKVYFTFDAGYDNGVLSKILDVLKEKDVKATIFVTGDFLEREQDLVLRIVEEGHIIGNHTYNHKNITKINDSELVKEISSLENKYKEITGKEMIKFFRPPAGEFNKASLNKVKELGYKTFFWSIAYKDWEVNNQHGGNYGFEAITKNLHNGAIILMHTVSTDNLECLPKVIDYIRDNGYEISELTDF